MIEFEKFEMVEDMPIYQQIILFIKRGVVSGQIQDGDELPSRRLLSALLGVNPNTVQKAYRQLEMENLVQSHSGAKSYMVLSDNEISRVGEELLNNDVLQIIRGMKQAGISKSDAINLIMQLWEEDI